MFPELYYVLSSVGLCFFFFNTSHISTFNPYTALFVYSNHLSQMNQGMDAITKIINKWSYRDLDSAIPTPEPVLNDQAIVKMLIAYARLGII